MGGSQQWMQNQPGGMTPGMGPKGGPAQQNQGWTTAPQAGQGMSGPGAGSAKGGGYNPYQSGANSVLSGLQSSAPMQYMQIQNMPPGPQRDALIRQAQGSDSGAGFNQAMKGAGYTLNPTPDASGMYTYNAPAGAGNTFTGGGSPGYQQQWGQMLNGMGYGQGGMGGKGGGGMAKGGGPTGWQGLPTQFGPNGQLSRPYGQPQAGMGIG